MGSAATGNPGRSASAAEPPMTHAMDHAPVTRRAWLRLTGMLGLAGVVIPLAGAPGRALGQGNLSRLQPEEPVAATMKRLFGDRVLKDGSSIMSLELPLLAENGAVVPISVEITAIPTPASYVKALYIVSDRNRRPLNAKVSFKPGPAQPFVATNLRLNETGDVRVIAEMNDGTLFMTKRDVKVTVGGCGG